MISRATIRSTASMFWSSAGGRSSFGEPVDLERAIVRTLPIAIHRVPSLSTHAVTDILASFGIQAFETGPSRDLRGCLVADVGVGFILVDGNDPIDEQRMTLAHETAHFLLHYAAPRQRAVSVFGPHIIPVLDRTRSVSRSELFSAALRAVPIMPFRHAMSRDGNRPMGQIAVMEMEADELALELLVPHEVVRPINADAATIASRFHIPETAAMRLVAYRGEVVTSIGIEGLFGIR